MLKDGQISFAAAVKRFFGLKEGQKIGELAAELKQLTPKDRADLAPELSKALGVEVVPE
jgi:hypothetical protein